MQLSSECETFVVCSYFFNLIYERIHLGVFALYLQPQFLMTLANKI
jgi:hypothetical protein